jgi:hypothetical protein
LINKTYKEVPLDGGDNPPKLVTVTYTSEPCSSGSRPHKFDLLETVVNTPGLLDCGVVGFQTMKMYHDGTKWMIVLEAKIN